MDKRILQTYATWAKETLENQIEVSLKALGINDENNIKQAKKVGDVTTIEGDPTSYPADLFGKRDNIITLVKEQGYKNVIEEFAYTWFNRFVALRFMEVHGFLSHGFRVLSDPAGGIEPEILKNLNLVKDELHLDMDLCSEYKQQGKIEELFRHVLIRQCNVLSRILPMLFSADLDYLELLLPNNLLKGETVITKLNEIPESAFLEEVEIIGWMYQFYISSKKDAVNKSKKTITKDTLPAVTQLFTPDWIVRYMAQNSVGRLWLESYPDSALRSEMKYYVDDAEQTEEVQRKIDEIKYKNVNPEEIRIIEPCCGSGHILVYVFELLYKMYEERGYLKRDIPTLILKNNLVGLDVDKRASQLASFSLIMKARSMNNRFFNDQYYTTPRVYEFKDSKVLEELNYQKHLKDLNLLNDEEIKMITYIVDTFKNGKTIGSLLKVKCINFTALNEAIDRIKKKAVSDMFNVDFLSTGIKRLEVLSNLANILSSKYDVMITNPPYIEISKMDDSVKEYAIKEYPASKTDMFAMFMETDFVKKNGFMSMINMHSWMFIPSYEKLRASLLNTMTIVNMAHQGSRGFEEISGDVVQTTAFILKNCNIDDYVGVYFKLDEYTSQQKKEKAFLSIEPFFSKQTKFFGIPGYSMAYWASEAVVACYKNINIYNYAKPCKGIDTGKNELFLRLWFEISNTKMFAPSGKKVTESDFNKFRWFPYNKGGSYRKWYGNNEYLLDWNDNGSRLKNYSGSNLRNKEMYFRPGVTWSTVSAGKSSFRLFGDGFLFDNGGSCLFSNKALNGFLGLLNSKVALKLLSVQQNLNTQPGTIGSIPINFDLNDEDIDTLVSDNVQISKMDWDSFETSWDFEEHPFVRWSKSLWDTTAIGATIQHYYSKHLEVKSPVELCYMLWQGECKERFDKLKSNEEELNRIFIDIYGLQDELAPEVEDDAVTVYLADKERDVRSFISYLIGVAMGRYSLDTLGLTYAGGEWDTSKYVTYQPDDDGIIPIYKGVGMEDGLTTVLTNLIKQIYGEDSYRENMDFIAEALGKKSNESSEETLNRYLNDGFYKDHLKIYQRRPIYWLFTSGDNSGFKCLVYMHRYNEDTLARINGKYLLPESTRKKNELEELNGKIAHSEGRDRVKYEKQRQNHAAAYNEAVEYGQVLDHMANQYISIDLDDGVKVNYAKFQGVEIVTDNGTKVKKDLLSSL